MLNYSQAIGLGRDEEIDYVKPPWLVSQRRVTALLPQDVVPFTWPTPRCWQALVSSSITPRLASDLSFSFRQAFLVRKYLGKRWRVAVFAAIGVIFARRSAKHAFHSDSHDVKALTSAYLMEP